ncbi:sugar kinase [Caballeronia megalochromosomata]|nr:sugar kinase [Caballeronia megalochromosomata]
MSDKHIICLGSALWDTILSVDHIPAHGGKVLPTIAVQAASGMATVAAVTIARLGGRVSLWSRIGDDHTGQMFIEDLAQEGVATDAVRRVPNVRTPFSTILVDRNGERLVVPYFDPALDTDTGWLPLHEIANAGAVLCDMRWMQGAKLLFSEAQRLGIPTILDADVAPVEDLRAMMPLADHVLLSEPALHSLSDAPTPEDALMEVASTLSARVIGVTLGARGSIIWENGGAALRHFPTIKIVARDTLNAGDVWHGTYAYGVARGWDLARTVRAASVAAAMKCEHFGGRAGAPRMDQLMERMERCESALL